MIVDITTLKEMIKGYFIMGQIEYKEGLDKYSLIYNSNNNTFSFFYTIKINDIELNNKVTLFKNDVIYILNYFLKNDNRIVNNYNIIDFESDGLNILLNFESIQKKQMVKRYTYEIWRIG